MQFSNTLEQLIDYAGMHLPSSGRENILSMLELLTESAPVCPAPVQMIGPSGTLIDTPFDDLNYIEKEVVK